MEKGGKTLKDPRVVIKRKFRKPKTPYGIPAWVFGAIVVAIAGFMLLYYIGDPVVTGRARGKPARVTFAIMVKNENRTIARVLNSVKDEVQGIVICDTGSDDGTQDTVHDYFQALENAGRALPYDVVSFKWEDDFALNRNLCMDHAKQVFPENDYVLTIDADEVLRVNDPEWRRKIPYDRNLIRYEGNLHHPLPRLFSAKHRFRYICVIHEVVDHLSNTTSGEFHGISVVNYADGHSSGEDVRQSRNVRLLEKGLKRGKSDPCYARYVFYMAQAFFEMQDFRNSSLWYQHRVGLGGYAEEIYFSIYRMALSQVRLGGLPTNVSGIFLQAYEFRPWRAEALYSLAELHKNHRNYKNCQMFAERAIMPIPKSDQLFVRPSVYHWEAYDMAGYCSYYLKEYTTARTYWRKALAGVSPLNKQKVESLQKNVRLCDAKLPR